MLKYVSLVTLTLQNAVLILVVRYVRVRPGDMFLPTTAVVLAEFVKLTSCLVIIFVNVSKQRCGGWGELVITVYLHYHWQTGKV